MRLRPVLDRVLIKREKFNGGSIIIPDEAAKRNAPSVGIVIDVGEGCAESIQELKGKKVLFGQYAGAWINEDGTAVTKEEDKELYVCQDEDVIAEVTT